MARALGGRLRGAHSVTAASSRRQGQAARSRQGRFSNIGSCDDPAESWPWADRAVARTADVVYANRPSPGSLCATAIVAKCHPLRQWPFASPNALFTLSKLSVWWLGLGISIERIKPGHPQQNGRHERMHLTLKKEATRPPGMNSLQLRARFDHFVEEFNTERPHEALAIKCLAEVYSPSRRPYTGLPDLAYPFHDATSSSQPADASACTERRSTSLSSSPDRGLA